MILNKLWQSALLSAAGFCVGLSAHAADIKATPVATGLENPTGVAVHPKSGDLFVVGKFGVGRHVPGKTGVQLEVTGFKTDIYGKGPMVPISALGVAVWGENHIVVGDGSQPDSQELVRIYKIGSEAPAKPASPESAAYTLGPIGPGDASAKGEGNFYGVALTDKGIFITSNGDDTKGWILRSELKAGKPGPLTPFIATKPLVNVDAPVGITTSADGKQLVVGQMGEVNVAGDSLLTTYDPETGKLLKNWKTGLNDIAGLAYSPKTGKLYVVDYSWMDTKAGGLFRLDVTGDEVKAEKLLSLDRPTALAFDKAGNLYITVLGTGKDDDKGALLKVASGL